MSEPQVVTDRQGLEVLSTDECWRLVSESPVGRVAFVEAGEPVILPVNHVTLGHRIAFLTAPGSKLGAAMMAEPVGFEVDGFDVESRTGWSVVVKGVADPVYDKAEMAALDETGLAPWATKIERVHWVRIMVSEISGRRLSS